MLIKHAALKRAIGELGVTEHPAGSNDGPRIRQYRDSVKPGLPPVEADPGQLLGPYARSPGFDGQPRGDSPMLCVNPLTGTLNGTAPASANLGTLVPNPDLTGGELVVGMLPGRCDARGLLLIGAPPELGPYVLPGNNYHVYDVPLFWRNVQQDVGRRVRAWAAR